MGEQTDTIEAAVSISMGGETTENSLVAKGKLMCSVRRFFANANKRAASSCINRIVSLSRVWSAKDLLAHAAPLL